MEKQGILSKIRQWFEEDCAVWWRLWSNRLALLVAAGAAWIVENPMEALRWVEALEQPWRSVLTFAVTAGIPILVRMARQPSLEK